MLPDVISSAPGAKPSDIKLPEDVSPSSIASAATVALSAASTAQAAATQLSTAEPGATQPQSSLAGSASTQPSSAQPSLTRHVAKVMWQIFTYARAAGLKLPNRTTGCVWTSQTMPGKLLTKFCLVDRSAHCHAEPPVLLLT